MNPSSFLLLARRTFTNEKIGKEKYVQRDSVKILSPTHLLKMIQDSMYNIFLVFSFNRSLSWLPPLLSNEMSGPFLFLVVQISLLSNNFLFLMCKNLLFENFNWLKWVVVTSSFDWLKWEVAISHHPLFFELTRHKSS